MGYSLLESALCGFILADHLGQSNCQIFIFNSNILSPLQANEHRVFGIVWLCLCTKIPGVDVNV